MQVKIAIPIIAALLIVSLAFRKNTAYRPIEVKGTVLDAQTRKPLAQLHVYASKGEEEAFTDEKGAFHFKSWQKLPLTIAVRGDGNKEKIIQVVSVPVQVTVLFP